MINTTLELKHKLGEALLKGSLYTNGQVIGFVFPASSGSTLCVCYSLKNGSVRDGEILSAPGALFYYVASVILNFPKRIYARRAMIHSTTSCGSITEKLA